MHPVKKGEITQATPTDSNKLSVNQSLKRRRHLLSGLLKCGLCGANMTIAGGAEKRYYCSTAKELGKSQCSVCAVSVPLVFSRRAG
ncbi:recombinase zinc beta ribbon domain-containing protein [Roseinatronobacter monicus]|uniref:recombinase zinc beta ribbon domain-containing protein n=1 Tax=Roseinatronobacter monicus TaxID=393481 RepID=UPI0011503FCE|nr:zinc ribbon domain-containing protein [Roseinatronobacter monicus]